MKSQYVDLHLHTDYSLLDGLGGVQHYVQTAKKQGKNALAITDHGLLSGTHEFYMACKKEGIAPILGEEFYFIPNAAKAKDDKENERFHIVILARNLKGFELLCELSTQSHRNYYYKPLLDRATIEALSKKDTNNLVVLSGCAASILSRKVLEGKKSKVHVELNWWRENFPYFFVELQSHGTDFDKKLNTRLLSLAKKHNLPWVVTNDSHYVTHEQEPYHDALLAIQTGANIDDPNRFSFAGTGYHLRTEKEMRRAFREYGKEVYMPGVKQTAIIARNCAIDIPQWDSASWHIPKYKDVDDSVAYLKKLTARGLKQKRLDKKPEYVKRAKHELREINRVGIADFLLINRDLIEYARNQGIRVGPGRGSTAGSLVAYLIGLHKVDSIRYGLLFERFLNPERPKMPDIDTDYSQARRDEVINYAYEKYGRGNVLPVAAFNTLQRSSAFQTLAASHGISFPDRIKLTKQIEVDEEGNAVLPTSLREGYPDLAKQIDEISGAKRAISSHAAGVLIFDPDDDIRKLVPEMWIPKKAQKAGRFVAQFDLHTCEKIKLMKNDFLGLRTLDTIDECISLIDARQGKGDYSDPDTWIPDEEEDDDLVYKMLADGHCAGVFQMEGSTNAGGIVKIKPTSFRDIVDCTSIYRAGPMDAGADKRYLKNKHDKKVRVVHPSLKEILKDSWGEMIFQEQMMEIANKIAGLSMAKVDEIKEIVRFKDPVRMKAFTEEFVEGCIKTTDMDQETAEKIWAMIEAQSTYLYNLSHATAYSIISYQTARFKRLYPLEFFTALMRTVMPTNDDAKAKRTSYLSEAMNHGYKIMPPDINGSGTLAICSGTADWDSSDPDDPGVITLGFQDVKGIGAAAAQKIVKLRDEGDVVGFFSYEEAKAILPEGIRTKLDAVGALASIGGPKPDPSILEEMLGWCFDDKMVKFRKKYADKVVLPSGKNDWVQIIGEIIESTKKKTRTNKPYMTWKIRWSPAHVFPITIWESARSTWAAPIGSVVYVEGNWQQEFGNVAIGDPSQIKLLKRVKKNATS